VARTAARGEQMSSAKRIKERWCSRVVFSSSGPACDARKARVA
jgi:hypothetical protein